MKTTLAAAGLLLGSVLFLSTLSGHLVGAEANPKTTLQQARTAARGHKLPEAVAAYEQVIASSSRDAAKYKADALYELLLLRLSADPAVRDLQRGAAAIEGLRAYPTYPRLQEIAVIEALMQETDRHAAEEQRLTRLSQLADQRLAEANTKAAAAAARADALSKQVPTARPADDSAKLRQESAALRAENRNLRDQLAKTQVELQKKDEALKKIAGSVMKPR